MKKKSIDKITIKLSKVNDLYVAQIMEPVQESMLLDKSTHDPRDSVSMLLDKILYEYELK